MTTKDFTANVISASKVVPDGNFKDSKASGIWDINEALDLIKGGNWPNAANVNPSAFVDALFQTHLYTGTAQARSIVNGIDLSGKGGLIWSKKRNGATNHSLFDSERSNANAVLKSNGTNAQYADDAHGVQFNNNGWSLTGTDQTMNANGDTYVNWTFRKQPKFFDIVTYTGNGSSGRSISHNLNSSVGMILFKRTDSTNNWIVWHRSAGGAYGFLDATDAFTADSGISNPTTTVFTIESTINAGWNASGGSYIAYLFAHNDDDGGFGEPGDQDIIKCGATGTYSAGTPLAVNLGFEPQWILVKQSDAADGWYITDVMREMAVDEGSYLLANSNSAENNTNNYGVAAPTPTGFILDPGSSALLAGGEFIYMAIRRGGMKTPTAASSVFGMEDYNSGGSGPVTGIVTDFSIIRDRDADAANYAATRLLGNSYLTPMLNSAEVSNANVIHDRMDGAWNTQYAGYMIWGWQRARGYFDIVGYSGTGSGAQNVSHNLGVVPEMMWIKVRNDADNWTVYHSALGNTKRLILNGTDAVSSANEIFFNDTTPTSSVFTVAAIANGSYNYVAYLFATVANVSKVGSFTQSGATNVACGFTGSTPALIILKRTDASGNWYILDAVRGIVAGNDPHTYINESNPEISNVDLVDPYSGGFATTSSLADGDYIFYAIASIA